MKKLNRSLGLVTLALSVGLAFCADSANAAFKMSFNRLDTSGVDIGDPALIISDDGTGDTFIGPNTIAAPFYDFGLGGFQADGFVITGTASSVSPTVLPAPRIDLLYNAVNRTGHATYFPLIPAARYRYEIKTTVTDMDASLVNDFLSVASANSSGGDLISIKTFVDDSNVEFGEGTLVHSWGPEVITQLTPFDDSAVDPSPSLSGLFSMTIAVVVELDPGATMGGNLVLGNVPVPEPSTLALGGLALFTMGVFAWKKRGHQR